jgi:hypothetical protein
MFFLNILVLGGDSFYAGLYQAVIYHKSSLENKERNWGTNLFKVRVPWENGSMHNIHRQYFTFFSISKETEQNRF